jgi:hypothetical protein
LREKVSPEATDEGCRRGGLEVGYSERRSKHPSSDRFAATFSHKGRRK